MSTFHPFPRLPLELRLTIWEMTVEPREVEVRIVQPTPQDPWEIEYSHQSQWIYVDSRRLSEAMSGVPTSKGGHRKAKAKALKEWKPYRPYVHVVSSIIPAVVQTCREARNHGLYQQISLDIDEQPNTDRRYVWVNLDIDLINIGTSDLVYFIPIASTIKRLKLSRDNTDEYGFEECWYEYEEDWLASFTSVEEIHVLCRDGFWNWGNHVYHCRWPCALEKLVFIDEDSPVGYLEVGHLEMVRIHRKMRMEGCQALVDEYQAGNMRSVDSRPT
jgi:hypothetical protein